MHRGANWWMLLREECSLHRQMLALQLERLQLIDAVAITPTNFAAAN